MAKVVIALEDTVEDGESHISMNILPDPPINWKDKENMTDAQYAALSFINLMASQAENCEVVKHE